LRLIGCLLLLSGFFLVAAALVLLTPLQTRFAFTLAGLGVEVLGVGLLTHGHKPMQKKEQR
jgi:ABC-type transport system involved in cytochrome bd biosynthesis fused ATPase/permease subunit